MSARESVASYREAEQSTPAGPAAAGASSALRHLLAGVMLSLSLSLPGGVQADEHLQAALAVVEPPIGEEIDRIVDSVADGADPADRKRYRDRLERVYGSNEFRQRSAEAYARHLSAEELRFLAETMAHPVFRRYRQIAPELMAELAEIERDVFARAN